MQPRWLRARIEGALPPVVVPMPDCFTSLGGNQYINSSAVGAYAIQNNPSHIVWMLGFGVAGTALALAHGWILAREALLLPLLLCACAVTLAGCPLPVPGLGDRKSWDIC